MKELELKSKLLDVQNNKISLEQENCEELVTHMLKYIGSIDPELRDILIHRTFSKMIIHHDYLNWECLNETLNLLLNEEYLLKGLGLTKDDSVFTRSFSVLLVAQILYSDNQHHFLDEGTLLLVKDCLMKYIQMEQDFRGYVKEKGWAHSVAHCADAIDELVLNDTDTFGQDIYEEFLTEIMKKIYVSTYAYHDEEDERLIHPLLAMLRKGFPLYDFVKHIDNISSHLKQKKIELDPENYWVLYANVKSFLRSLYFQVRHQPEWEIIKTSVEKQLSEIK